MKLLYYLMTAPALLAGDFNESLFNESVQSDAGLSSYRADSHAPIGVMGDHRHKAGEFMLSYRYMNMQMNENFIGTNAVTPQQANRPSHFNGDGEFRGIEYGPCHGNGIDFYHGIEWAG